MASLGPVLLICAGVILVIILIAAIAGSLKKTASPPPKTKQAYKPYQTTRAPQVTGAVPEEKPQYVYQTRKFLLTMNEYNFYKELQRVANILNLLVFAKVRMEDIIQVDKSVRQSWEAARSRIKSRHVDFVLCDKQNIRILMALELDDRTHDRPDRQERDAFVDEAMKTAGVPILHTRSAANLEKQIRDMLPVANSFH